jgi:DNA-binding HxlR family transcriptional regulator
MRESRDAILVFLCGAGRATFQELHEGTGRGSKPALMKRLVELREDGEVFEPTATHFAAVTGDK